jgi:GR25 family glycosyltransferase involved in LPS biosynthesis
MEDIPIPKLPWNIYWINLDRRPDRKQHMERLLINNQENSFRIQAVDYKNNFYPYNVIKHPKLKDGEHGCTSSHIKALSYFLENTSDEFCFITEDDLSNKYSAYWQDKHFEYLRTGSYEILQLQTTTDCFNSNELIPENKSSSGAAFYKIHRKIATKIVENHFDKKTLTINFTSHHHPVADLFIWSFGDTYLLPMFTYVDVKDSDTTPSNNDLNGKWIRFFQNAKNKYLYMWQNLPKETVP